MTNVLITGAGGFVGASLCRSLVSENYSVRALVRSLDTLIDRDTGAEYVEEDLLQADNLTRVCYGIECIVHLAGRAHIINEQSHNPAEVFLLANCETTIRLARQALESGVRRFIFVSSIGVNGSETHDQSFDEGSHPCPHTAYSVSKFRAEEGLKELVRGTQMELVIIRPPLVYGVNAPGNFGRLLRLVSKGIPLPLGRINNLRSFVSLRSLVSFIQICVNHPAAAGEIFLLSDDRDISTTEMVQALARGMQKRVLLVPIPACLFKIVATLLKKESLYTQLYCSLQIDSAKARVVLGWQSEQCILQGLEEVGQLYMSKCRNR